jgi:hypothetical protein
LQRRFVRYKPFEVGHLPWLSANGCVLRFDGAHQRLAGSQFVRHDGIFRQFGQHIGRGKCAIVKLPLNDS